MNGGAQTSRRGSAVRRYAVDWARLVELLAIVAVLGEITIFLLSSG